MQPLVPVDLVRQRADHGSVVQALLPDRSVELGQALGERSRPAAQQLADSDRERDLRARDLAGDYQNAPAGTRVPKHLVAQPAHTKM